MMLIQKKALVFGETRLCIQCVEYLIADGWIIPKIISDDVIVITWANSHSIKCWPFSQLSKIVEDDFYIFSIINPHIIPKEFLNKKNIYFGLNYHDSYLPKYAGINSTTWAIINGETMHGVTLHQINAGIDAGDIAEQTMVDVVPDETAFSLNLKCSEQLLVIFKSVISKIANDSLKLTPQLPLNRSYYGLKHIPENYAVINGIKDLHFLGSLTRGLEFAAEINPVATVKVYLNDRFYIVENGNLTANNIHFATVKDIHGQIVNTNISYTDMYTPHIINDRDLQYLAKIKSKERPIKQSFIRLLNADNLIAVLKNNNSNIENNPFSATLKLTKGTTFPITLAIIYFVLIRYFYEDFIVSLYTANNDIPDSLYNLVEKRNFILISKELLLLSLSDLEAKINDSLNNSPTIIKDFFYRYKLSSNTDIAIIVGQVPEIDKHQLTIILDDNQITINSTEQYQLQVNSLLECIETALAGKDGLLQANLASVNILNNKQYKKLGNMHSHKLEFPQNKTIHRLFEEQVLKTPNNIALVYEDIKLTYQELNTQANQLANYLLSNYQVRKYTLIALCLNRSQHMLIAILGVLKAGGAYVPIEPIYPYERISYIVTDTGAKLLITNQLHEDSLSSLKVAILGIDKKQISATLGAQSKKNPSTLTTSTDLAYVIYTSGTTGKPKGVLQQHNNVIRLFKATEEWYHFNNQDVWTLFHSYVFDFSVWEMWGAFIHGGKLVIPNITQVKNMTLFYELCYREKISILNQTPKSFYQFIEIASDKVKDCPLVNLRYIILGGDALQAELLLDWFNLYGYKKPALINMYGITETTVHVTYKQINASNITSNVDIGTPISDMQVYILDNHHNLVPIGASGELYIGGAGLARGYLNQPELTLQRFIVNPFQTAIEKNLGKNSRLYKTGDLACTLSDGSIKYIGRNDFQVKIRGYRIELGEIENAMVTYSGIRQVVVLAKSYANSLTLGNSITADKYLIAYYTASQALHKEDIMIYLKNKLPEYMIPSHFVCIEHLPLTINGKLDVSALPDIQKIAALSQHVSPQNEIQAAMCSILAEVLGLNISLVGIDDDFFNLGGDSILAIRFVSKINRILNSKLSVMDIYKYKTVVRLASILGLINIEHENFKYTVFSLIDKNKYKDLLWQDKIEDIYPASYLQIGMLLASSLDTTVYHDILCYRINRVFCRDRFLMVWNHLITKHQLLRAKFIQDNLYTYLVVITKFLAADCEIYSNQDTKQLMRQERLKEFDYERFGIYRLIINQNTNDFNLIFSLHHAIADGWSVASIINEFIQAYVYDKFSDNNYFDVSYAEFVKKEKIALQDTKSINFWQEYLVGLEFNANKWKFDKTHHSSNSVFVSTFNLDQSVSIAIYNLAKACSISIDTIFLYAYLETLALFLNTSDVTIGLVTNNRLEQDKGDELVGVYLNTIPYKFHIDHTQEKNKNLLRVFDTKVELNNYKHIPYGYIKSLINYEIFELAFNFINFHILKDSLSVITETHVYEKSNIPLLLNVYQQSTNFTLELVAHDSYIDQQYLGYFAKYLKIALLRIANNDNRLLPPLALDSIDYKHLIYVLNQTRKPYPLNKTIHQLFEKQVLATPNNIALIYKNIQLTYFELNVRANQLANYLLKHNQIKPDELIALCLNRNEYMLISIIAVLKTGGAYVPIDLDYPNERIKYVLQDTMAKLVLTNSIHRDKLSQFILETQNTIVSVDKIKLTQEQTINPQTTVNSNNLAYVIYTSGTTGQPNGVMVEHDSIINTILSLKSAYDLTLGNKITEFANYVFDVSVSEIFVALLQGAELHLLPDIVRIDVSILSQYLLDNKINFAYLPPVLLSKLPRIEYPELKSIVYAGEPCLGSVGEYWSNTVALYNFYGPTETSIYTIGKQVINGDTHLIGKPIFNHKVYIFDSSCNPIPIGAVGELYIGGVGLARGYLNQPELTASKFIANPFQTQIEKEQNKNSRIYKTGDLVRMLPDGNIEYIGRNDFQVKVRGYRIELSEIENALGTYPGIKQVVVLVKGDNVENKYIVAYYSSNIQLDETRLNNYLSTKLPGYMLPSAFIYTKVFQMNINGKLERTLLPTYTINKHVTNESQFNELEWQVYQVMQQLISAPLQLNSTSNFFTIGGNSIMAINLLNRINAMFKIQLKISDIFNGKTIEGIAKRISQIKAGFGLVTKLGKSDDKVNLFMLHPAFAGAEVYVELAEQLSSQFSCYGVENYNFYHKDKIINLNKLASYYLSEIDKIREATVQEDQPYILLGWSLGGQIALEIASILENTGFNDIKLVLIDTALTDSTLLYYYKSKFRVNHELYQHFLVDKEYLKGYLSKILENIDCDLKLVQQTTTNKLAHSSVLLFKAMQLGVRDYLENYSFHGKYIINLTYNNIDRIINANNINLVEAKTANHFSILNDLELIVTHVKSWYNVT